MALEPEMDLDIPDLLCPPGRTLEFFRRDTACVQRTVQSVGLWEEDQWQQASSLDPLKDSVLLPGNPNAVAV